MTENQNNGIKREKLQNEMHQRESLDDVKRTKS